ncbi:MFS transporter [Micrococcales bacterium 31B]|nr:MFS transporter [Micrococcales bacterium 31B]
MSNYIEAGAIIALATSLSLWQDQFGFTDGTTGIIAALSANAFGAAIGAAVGGPLCDRYGRKFIYTYDLLLFIAGALIVALTPGVPLLIVGVVAMGIAVGAGVTASWTYIAEQAPSRERAAHVGMAQLAWSVGPMIGFLLAFLVEPLGLLGSRLIFVHLAVIAFITWWVRRGLKESGPWKERHDAQQRGEIERGGLLDGVVHLLKDRRNVGPLLLLVGVYGLWNLVAGQSGIFQPRVYEAAGLTNPSHQNLLQVFVWGMTVVGTYFGFMRFADRVSRRALYVFGAALGIIGWIILIWAPPGAASLWAFAILWGISSGLGAQAFYGLWTAELFPTRYRASAQGFLFMIARVGVGLLSSVFPVLLTSWGLSNVGILLVALLLAALVIGGIWAPRTEGKTLEEIEYERYGTVNGVLAAGRPGGAVTAHTTSEQGTK